MEQPHPVRYRRPILAAALAAVVTWWGLGLPYSLFVWLLDEHQLRWTLLCYVWEVPAAGFLGPVLFPQLWWRRLEREWDRVFADPAHIDADAAAALEGRILDYPLRVALVLVVASLVGYGVGGIQLRVFAQLPLSQQINVGLLGVVTGLVGGLFAYLYLERLLAPLLRRLGATRPTTPPRGRRVPLHRKVFASSLVLVFAVLPLLGTVFWNDAARILEEEIGTRILGEVRELAARIAAEREPTAGRAAWRAHAERMGLGASGDVYVVDADGSVVLPAGETRSLAGEGFRPSVVATILTERAGRLVDRTGSERVVAFTRLGGSARRLVAVVKRSEFDYGLVGGLRKAGIVSVVVVLLTLGGSFLFARRLSRPIEIVTAMANQTARAPADALRTVPVRTNDEVGELAVAFNQMTARLDEARDALVRYSGELEARVAEATRSIATLYEVTRATTSTLEVEDVLKLVAERISAALGLRQLVLLRYAAGEAGADAYLGAAGGEGERVALDGEIDLATLRAAARDPSVVPLAMLAPALPPAVAHRLAGPDLLVLPLVFKGEPLGVVLASLERATSAPDLELAAALAGQAAVALANAGLFAAVRGHEEQLRELSEMRMRVQEESLRSLSRELHDGLGQGLTAIKLDLAMIEQLRDPAPATLQARVRDVRAQVATLIQEVRRMSQLLRPSILDDLGLVPSLRSLVEQFTGRTGIAVDLRLPAIENRLPAPIEVLLYRVTQEALTNIVKHARAHHASVALTVGEAAATLVIADDGVGFDLERLRRAPGRGGVGLLGMRERVAYYRGRIDIRARPLEGVHIALSIPLDGGIATEPDDEPSAAEGPSTSRPPSAKRTA